ncbi:MAG: DUF2461 domain-containing protein [Turneriella sp.]|nr:DUF2461 domain-containing protein [Turneriella sp.]
MTESDLKFLKALKRNNNREWFQKHKAEADTAQKNFLDLVGGLIFALSEYDDAFTTIDPKSSVFRIYRDVRFSKDKSPYKSHLGAYICAGGRKSDTIPGYYLHFEPGGQSMFAGGYYMPEKTVLENLRKDVAAPQSRIVTMLADKAFRKDFPILGEEDKAKKVPRGFDAKHPQAELLKMRHFFVYSNLPDHVVTGKKLLHYLGARAASLHRWNETLLNIARKR